MSRSCARLGLLLLASCAAAAGAEEKRRVPTYTNADLERVSPRRGDTGVTSEVISPSPAPPGEADAGGAESARRARSEAYWRRQADRQRERQRLATQRIEDLRGRIAEREARPRRRSADDPQLEGWRR
ncbi:MAG TPA: hypothetical protein VMR21_17025, partial [Vicinamibacteria bacterium]|nr:hypothetical protein [Vicinamibacteria bacterium]